MAGNIKAVRGMHDTLPETTPSWQYMEQKIRNVLQGYGYREIRFPILEKTELFERSIGETTDIVSKEMYTFTDRNGDYLTLRPEGTAGCVRAGIEHGLFHNNILRLWYSGAMFRHERPQKGRLRQFHQTGVEAFGLPGPDIDAEIILMSARIWSSLGLDGLTLEINTLGSNEARQKYRDILKQYFANNYDNLDNDSRTRLDKNPLRILDSKNPEMQPLVMSAPTMDQYLDSDSAEHFAGLRRLLDATGLDYKVNPRLVRGLDYYNKTVFEWMTDQLGAQGTVCAGGRYDGLVEHFGGKPTPGFGFALGMERLYGLVKQSKSSYNDSLPHVYVIIAGDKTVETGIRLVEQIRDNLPELRLLMHCGGGSFKSQFKKADKSGADIALILGDEELENKTVGVKPLREKGEQEQIQWTELINVLRNRIKL